MLLQSGQIQPNTLYTDKQKQPSFTGSVRFVERAKEISDCSSICPFLKLSNSVQNAILAQKNRLEATFPHNFQIIIGGFARNEEIGFDSGRSKDIYSIFVKFREAVVKPLNLWTPSGLLGRIRGKKTKLAGKWQELPLIDYFERSRNCNEQGEFPEKHLIKSREDIDIAGAIKDYLKTAQAKIIRQQKIAEANMAAGQHEKMIQLFNGHSQEEIESGMAEIEALLRKEGSEKALTILQKLHDMGFLRDSREYSNRLPQETANNVALLPAISTKK